METRHSVLLAKPAHREGKKAPSLSSTRYLVSSSIILSAKEA